MNRDFDVLDESLIKITQMLIMKDFEVRKSNDKRKYVIDELELYKFSIKLLKLLIKVNEMEVLE